jgi:hypothetical protein
MVVSLEVPRGFLHEGLGSVRPFRLFFHFSETDQEEW